MLANNKPFSLTHQCQSSLYFIAEQCSPHRQITSTNKFTQPAQMNTSAQCVSDDGLGKERIFAPGNFFFPNIAPMANSIHKISSLAKNNIYLFFHCYGCRSFPQDA